MMDSSLLSIYQFIIGTLTHVVMVSMSVVISSNSSDTPNNLKTT